MMGEVGGRRKWANERAGMAELSRLSWCAGVRVVAEISAISEGD